MANFHPDSVEFRTTDQVKVVNWKGHSFSPLQSPALSVRQAELFCGDTSSFEPHMLDQLPLFDPATFLAGGLNRRLDQWDHILCNHPMCDTLKSWLKFGVHIPNFFRPFKGDFKGVHFDSVSPPSKMFGNSPSCKRFLPFIASTLEERLKQGSMRLLGRVGEVPPPQLVMPLTVEPSKPRLCHDERFLNLWISDNPFSLDTLKDLPRLLQKGDRMMVSDEKSGYDHVLVSPESQTYLGVQFFGWYLVYTTLPFGFRASAFCYQMLGAAVSSYLREQGISNMQYIDDRLVVIPSQGKAIASHPLATVY
jgi:hypothetical protein